MQNQEPIQHPSMTICPQCHQPQRRENRNGITIRYACECGATSKNQRIRSVIKVRGVQHTYNGPNNAA